MTCEREQEAKRHVNSGAVQFKVQLEWYKLETNGLPVTCRKPSEHISTVVLMKKCFLLLCFQYKVLGQRFMKFCHCFTRNGLRKGLQAKYTITCFLDNGQRMRTNIVAIDTRPSFFLNFN